MATEWVDFKVVKKAVTMQMVLDRYGITNLNLMGDELRGPCPIHKGSAKSKNFSVNVHKNAFQCFSKDCKARGNVLDFVAAMEHCEVRDAAIKLKDWFKTGESRAVPEQAPDSEQTNKVPHGIYSDSEGSLFEVIANAVSGEDLEPLVVYRELFGDYRFWVAPLQNFGQDKLFTLVKAL
jgi:hypothetical protein